LLTVETEANGDSWSTYERGSSLVGLLSLVMTIQREGRVDVARGKVRNFAHVCWGGGGGQHMTCGE
jgi:hypothetical protein